MSRADPAKDKEKAQPLKRNEPYPEPADYLRFEAKETHENPAKKAKKLGSPSAD